MLKSVDSDTIITNVRVKSEFVTDFVDWQTHLSEKIAKSPGFVSLEIVSLTKDPQPIWSIVQRFSSSECSQAWRESTEYNQLIDQLRNLLTGEGPDAIQDLPPGFTTANGGVTEVFVTDVSPENEEAYRVWIAKMHQEEAKFPGFRGMFVQSPIPGRGRYWLTFLHFDTTENLDRWLTSTERQKVLEESKPLIASLESHRVFSPYGGWFESLEKNGELPSVWKQTMLVLLVLFPIVMLELKFLPYLTGKLNPSLGTFIGNAISVTLISWPFMPIAIWFLGWWLAPGGNRNVRTNLLGFAIVCGLYLAEIALLWNLL